MNKLGRINKAVPLLGLMFFLVCPSLVLAESVSPTITISPPKFDLVITPGQFQQTQIKITNHSDVAIPFHVVPMDFAPKDTKGGIDFGQSIPEHSAVSWFKISPQD